MNAKTIRILSFIGKTAGLALTVAGPFSGTPVGMTVFAVASFLKDAANRMGDLADDGNQRHPEILEELQELAALEAL